jgi:hypothetical protein
MYLWCVLIHSSTINEDGDSPHVWRIAMNIMNKFPGTADQVCSSSLRVSREDDNRSVC